MNKAKRVTLAQQMFLEKKSIPGPSKYDIKDINRPTI